MPSLEGNKEDERRKNTKNMNPNKLLIRLPVLLAQIKPGIIHTN